jgi:hypothetical protein
MKPPHPLLYLRLSNCATKPNRDSGSATHTSLVSWSRTLACAHHMASQTKKRTNGELLVKYQMITSVWPVSITQRKEPKRIVRCVIFLSLNVFLIVFIFPLSACSAALYTALPISLLRRQPPQRIPPTFHFRSHYTHTYTTRTHIYTHI